jgi:hypothetical protein
MTITYDEVKPWGRSFDEYVGMFALTEADLCGRILGCADGPASFNAEATAKGYQVVSVDPIYALTAAQIEQRVNETWQAILEQMRTHMEIFVWKDFKNLDEVGQARLTAMRRFTADLEQGKRDRRYLDASLPALPFEDARFDLALSKKRRKTPTLRFGERRHRDKDSACHFVFFEGQYMPIRPELKPSRDVKVR